MRYKVVPPARGIEELRDVQAAVPLVPGNEEDCCSRIRDRTEIPSRDEAREWLTFCQALGLVAEAETGFHRVREEPAEATLADRFEANVLGAREIRDRLDAAEGPLTVDNVFSVIEPLVPRWERSRSANWEATWRERTDRLLEWWVTFGVAEATDGRYRLV